jgi:hypothetical protein
MQILDGIVVTLRLKKASSSAKDCSNDANALG